MFEVYCHTSPSGKRYVGYSQHSMAARWRQHAASAVAGSPYLLHRAIRKYGAGSFGHELLAQCDTREGACAAERQWIRSRATMAPAGYNATAGGEGVSAAPHVRAKIGASQRGRVHTAEHVEKNRAAQTGRVHSLDTRQKMSVSWTAERRRVAAERMRARVHVPLSEESLARGAASRRGYHHTPETRQRMSASHTGQRRTPEVRQKISAAAYAREAARRAAREKEEG